MRRERIDLPGGGVALGVALATVVVVVVLIEVALHRPGHVDDSVEIERQTPQHVLGEVGRQPADRCEFGARVVTLLPEPDENEWVLLPVGELSARPPSQSFTVVPRSVSAASDASSRS